MDKSQVSISLEEYREYQCLKKGIKYIPPKESSNTKLVSVELAIKEIDKEFKKYFSKYRKDK